MTAGSSSPIQPPVKVTRPGLSRSASAIVTSRRPSLRDGQAGRRGRSSRPITFAIPAAAPVTGREGEPVSSSPASPSSHPPNKSFLNRITRKLSQSRTTLVRRVSGGGGGSPRKSTSSARASEGEKENRPVSFIAPAGSPPAVNAAPTTTIDCQPASPLKKALRVSVGLRRTKSEAKRGGKIQNEEERMEELVRRTEETQEPHDGSDGQEGVVAAAAAGTRSPRAEDWTEVHSNLGSYFWSDSLGVCWDGREQVHPDFLFSFQPYSSDSDALPPPQTPIPQPLARRRAPPQPAAQCKVVYASTLSSFPPRPPLRPKTPEPEKETEAQRVRREWREANGLVTPRPEADGLEEGEEAEEAMEWEGQTAAETPPLTNSSVTPAGANPEATEEVLNASSTSSSRPSLSSLPATTAFSSTQPISPHRRLSPTATTLPRPLSPMSFSSAYSTPTSEPPQFYFAFEEEEEEGGETEETKRDEVEIGGVKMSSEGSETSLESVAAARAAAGKAKAAY